MITRIIDKNEVRAECLAGIFQGGLENSVDLLLFHINDPFPEFVETKFIIVYSGGGVIPRGIERNPQLVSKRGVYWLEQGLRSDCEHLSTGFFTEERRQGIRDFVTGKSPQPHFISGPFND